MSKNTNPHHDSRAIYPPYLPQMADDGLITEADLQMDNYIFVEVRAYQSAEHGDEIRLYFADHPPILKLIQDPIKDFPIIYSIPAEPLEDGTYNVYYIATDTAGNSSTSPSSEAILRRNGR